ncbi:MAG TPA: preprotein translocase subunit SecG, partial [Verrucomicrobia bacterium]|nr:preprotein translocase subunit SecG [Verrucomicrobiota bacterium]
MIILKSLLLIVLVISSISLIGLILLQRSKSEG